MTSLKAATAALFERLRPDSVPEFVDAEFVVAPADAAEAAAVISVAAEAGLRVGFHGSGTHRGLGYPVDSDVAVLTRELAGIIDYQPEDLTLVVGAGTTLEEIDHALADHRQTAVLPETSPTATVGGVVSAGASGHRRHRYGPTRDRVLEVTMATGYGQVVRAGGRVVKNVTGYDLPRLCTGSFGSLGLVTSVCLKLWPVPIREATIAVDDAAAVRALVYRPLAVLETEAGSNVFVSGTEAEVAAHAAAVGSEAMPGLTWPEPPDDEVRVGLRVPARLTTEAVGVAKDLGASRYVAAHGVGEVVLGLDELDLAAGEKARSWAESSGGALVLLRGPDDLYGRFDPWGTPPPSLELQRSVKSAFDPAGICNPGKLPGRL
jgi:glycolate oxidase FAD binding subunit